MTGKMTGIDKKEYPLLAEYSTLIAPLTRKIVGREAEIRQLRAAMERPELCNALLLAPAGAGKTTLVQALSEKDSERDYREVDLARMISGMASTEELASKLKKLFDEAERYVVDEGIELILFIDEIHQIVQLSPAAVEALKPILAASGTRGIRVIAATTYDEFHLHMSSNLPLVERLQRINLNPPDREVTIQILRGMAEQYGVADQFYDDTIFRMIYDYTELYMPMSIQPRKSLLILDAMVGWYKSEGRRMDKTLVADVLEDTANVNVAFNVEARKIKEQIDKKVFSQDFATSVVARRLQIAVADLHDKTRPMSSFLFTGSTGVGKFCVDSTEVPVFSKDRSVVWKKHGDLVPGDEVFGRDGQPIKVLGHFPQGKQDIYRVTLWDGRNLDVGGPHLWGVLDDLGQIESVDTVTIQERLAQGESVRIPMNGGVLWPERPTTDDGFVDEPYLLEETLVGDLLRHRWSPEHVAWARKVITGSKYQREVVARNLLAVAPEALYNDPCSVELFDDDAIQIARDLLFSLGIEHQATPGRVLIDGSQSTMIETIPGTTSVEVVSVEKLPEQESASCIYVDHPEHLYQAGPFVVTHNTELTKQLAKILFGDDQRHLIRFDMTEFSQEASVTLFQEELAQEVWNLPYSVILFDEIEKAAPNVSRLLLQVLDDGRISNKDGREVSFLNAYIVLTTNAASEIYQDIGNYMPDDDGSGAVMMKNMRVIRRSIKSAAGNKFPPELLGRIDDIVPFSPLSRSTQRDIVRSKLWDLVKDVLSKHGVRVHIDNRVLDFLIEDKGETDSDSGGAREAIRRMTNEVTSQVAAFINEHPEEKSIDVSIVGELVYENKNRLESDAYVSVTAKQ